MNGHRKKPAHITSLFVGPSKILVGSKGTKPHDANTTQLGAPSKMENKWNVCSCPVGPTKHPRPSLPPVCAQDIRSDRSCAADAAVTPLAKIVCHLGQLLTRLPQFGIGVVIECLARYGYHRWIAGCRQQSVGADQLAALQTLLTDGIEDGQRPHVHLLPNRRVRNLEECASQECAGLVASSGLQVGVDIPWVGGEALRVRVAGRRKTPRQLSHVTDLSKFRLSVRGPPAEELAVFTPAVLVAHLQIVQENRCIEGGK
mmetsp:Transcript_7279/g.17733  ORF Transcript_7279/g.17733 Transcript_7279/m.17733 type:complete len:258 (-) Transcript_7279:745-1518(-)